MFDFWRNLLRCWRKDPAVTGKPRLRQAEPKMHLVMVKDVLVLVLGSFLACQDSSGTLGNNDFMVYLVARNIDSELCISFV